MFIQTLLLQAPPPLAAFQLPLDWSTGLPLQISVRTDLLFRRNCSYPAVFTAATCIIGECRGTSCDIHITQMSIKRIVHRFHCAIPSFKYSPDVFSKELSECPWLMFPAAVTEAFPILPLSLPALWKPPVLVCKTIRQPISDLLLLMSSPVVEHSLTSVLKHKAGAEPWCESSKKKKKTWGQDDK